MAKAGEYLGMHRLVSKGVESTFFFPHCASALRLAMKLLAKSWLS